MTTSHPKWRSTDHLRENIHFIILWVLFFQSIFLVYDYGTSAYLLFTGHWLYRPFIWHFLGTDPGFSVLGSILNLCSPLLAFLTFNSGGWLSMAYEVDSVFPYGDPSHCYLSLPYPSFVTLVCWFFSLIFLKLVPLPLVCLRLSLIRLPFCAEVPSLDLLWGPFLSVESSRFYYFCSSHFLILE